MGDGSPEGAGRREDAARVRVRAPRPGDLGWIFGRNAALCAEEFGWDETYEALVADFAGGHDPAA